MSPRPKGKGNPIGTSSEKVLLRLVTDEKSSDIIPSQRPSSKFNQVSQSPFTRINTLLSGRHGNGSSNRNYGGGHFDRWRKEGRGGAFCALGFSSIECNTDLNAESGGGVDPTVSK